MHKNQSSYYGMVGALIIFHDEEDKVPIWSGQAVYAAHVAELKITKKEIETLHSKQLAGKGGASAQKKHLREEMTELAHKVSSRVYAYGLVEELSEIEDEMRLSKTIFNRMKDKAVAGLVDRVLSVAAKYLDNLGPYHVDQNLLDEVEAAKADYVSYIGQPRQTIMDVADATAKMKAAYAKLRRIVTTLDNMVNIFEAEHPSFVMQYFIIRRIHDPARHKLELRARVIDSVSNQPIEGVIVRIPDTKIKRKTRSRGVFQVVNLREGPHQIHLSHPDYLPQIFTVIIVNNRMTEISIPLVHI